VHFDGGASKSNFSAWKIHKQSIEKIEYHWKLKYLSAFFNANALTFSILNGNKKNQLSIPEKFMGYASHGKYVSEIEEWLIANKYFENIWTDKRIFFEKARKFNNYNKTGFDQIDPFIQDVMANIFAFANLSRIGIIVFFDHLILIYLIEYKSYFKKVLTKK